MWTRGNKFRARKTNGFASGLENSVHEVLLKRKEAGEIENIRQQQVVVLLDCSHCGTKVKWKVDFSFTDVSSGKTVYCEAKGVETKDYKRKLRAWKKDPPFDLEIWKGSWQRPKLFERIYKK